MKTTIIAVLFSVSLIQQSLAASAVAYCKETRAYGYSFDYATLQEAVDAAKQCCRDREGRSPEIICSSTGAGFGAIAFNDSNWQIYATAAYADLKEAMATAHKNCPGGKVLAIWYDCGGKTTPGDTDIANRQEVNDLRMACAWGGFPLYP